MGTMITMLSPDGSSGEIPIDKVDAAKQAGFKVAVTMKSPDGKNGYVPAENVHDAAAKGFRMVPMEVPEAAKASYWDALTNPVGSGGREQGVISGALQVGGQAVKAIAQPLAHPLDSIAGAYNMVRHPVDTAAGIVNQVKSDYAQGGVPLAAENLAGQVIGAVESGRVLPAITKTAATKAVSPLVKKTLLLGKTPEGAYESALKIPPAAMSQAERNSAVQAGLQNAIPVSKAGFEKLGDLVDDLNQRIKDEISADPNRPIDPNKVATRSAAARKKFSKQVNAGGDLNAIEASRQQFLDERGAQPGKPAIAPKPTGVLDSRGNPIMDSGSPAQPPKPAPAMNAIDAQEMKQGTYRVLKGKFGEQGSASVEAQKSLARGLKEEIAAQFPEIDKLNAAESRLLDLQPVLERAVNRISNHQGISLGVPAVIGAAKAATSSNKFAIGLGAAKAILDNPEVKSRLAIAVSKGGGVPYSQALSRVQSYLTSLGSLSSVGQESSSGGTPSQ